MPKAHHRSRSSIDRALDLLADLDETQLELLLQDVNSTVSSNVAVAQAVDMFEREKRRSVALNRLSGIEPGGAAQNASTSHRASVAHPGPRKFLTSLSPRHKTTSDLRRRNSNRVSSAPEIPTSPSKRNSTARNNRASVLMSPTAVAAAIAGRPPSPPSSTEAEAEEQQPSSPQQQRRPPSSASSFRPSSPPASPPPPSTLRGILARTGSIRTPTRSNSIKTKRNSVVISPGGGGLTRSNSRRSNSSRPTSSAGGGGGPATTATTTTTAATPTRKPSTRASRPPSSLGGFSSLGLTRSNSKKPSSSHSRKNSFSSSSPRPPSSSKTPISSPQRPAAGPSRGYKRISRPVFFPSDLSSFATPSSPMTPISPADSEAAWEDDTSFNEGQRTVRQDLHDLLVAYLTGELVMTENDGTTYSSTSAFPSRAGGRRERLPQQQETQQRKGPKGWGGLGLGGGAVGRQQGGRNFTSPGALMTEFSAGGSAPNNHLGGEVDGLDSLLEPSPIRATSGSGTGSNTPGTPAPPGGGMEGILGMGGIGRTLEKQPSMTAMSGIFEVLNPR